MAPIYTAHFKYEYAPHALPEVDERAGNGVCQVTIERDPETPEEWREVSREIFKAASGAYQSVEVVKLFVLPQHATEDNGEVLEGTVLD